MTLGKNQQCIYMQYISTTTTSSWVEMQVGKGACSSIHDINLCEDDESAKKCKQGFYFVAFFYGRTISNGVAMRKEDHWLHRNSYRAIQVELTTNLRDRCLV